MDDRTTTLLGFDQLSGWPGDDHSAALSVFCKTCGDLSGDDWVHICGLSKTVQNARAFFEQHFQPVLISDGSPMLFTGYYEPELQGTSSPDPVHQYPIYTLPPDLPKGAPWLTRQQIEQTAALSGQGLEIAWLSDPLEVFFLQVQGSGRIKLPNAQIIRVGYAGRNGHPYVSIGAELIARGISTAGQMTTDAIRAWAQANPDVVRHLLWTNPSYVFFRHLDALPTDQGPLGAMNRSVTPLRSIAVDPAFVPLGAPVWIEKAGDAPMNRLMIAQDTGSAIKGAQRADIFYGTGVEAGQQAGKIRDTGRMVVFLPKQIPSLLP